MKKILITGSTGFIGSNLFLNLKNKHYIYLLLRKKRKKKFSSGKNQKIIYFKNYKDLNSQIKKIKIDTVVHCATHYVKKHNFDDISKIIKANIFLGNVILENLKKMNVKKFINFSTVWENYNNKKDFSFNLYSAYKQSFRKIIDYYKFNNKKTKFYNIFISDTYGKNDKRKKLVNFLKYNYLKNKKQKIISKKLYINLLNVEDIVKAINLIISKNIMPGNYTLKNKLDFNMINLIKKINKVNNKKLSVQWMSSKVIKEKIYPYKTLPKWKPHFSNINNLVNFIINK